MRQLPYLQSFIGPGNPQENPPNRLYFIHIQATAPAQFVLISQQNVMNLRPAALLLL